MSIDYDVAAHYDRMAAEEASPRLCRDCAHCCSATLNFFDEMQVGVKVCTLMHDEDGMREVYMVNGTDDAQSTDCWGWTAL